MKWMEDFGKIRYSRSQYFILRYFKTDGRKIERENE